MMSGCNGSKTPQLNGVILDKLLTALEKAYNFYESEFEDVNLDGIYGLRVSEGKLFICLYIDILLKSFAWKEWLMNDSVHDLGCDYCVNN